MFFNPAIDPASADRWVVVTCYLDGSNASWIEAVYRVGDPAIVDLLVRRAADYLVVPLPTPKLAPPPDALHLVGIPEYLAVDPARFTTQTVTVSVPGTVLTLVAAPIETRWDLGNGDTVTCAGAGTPWSTHVNEKTACTYTYRYSSTSADNPDGAYTVTAATVWQRSWTCAPSCGSGTLPLLARPNTFSMVVRQAQAQITGAN